LSSLFQIWCSFSRDHQTDSPRERHVTHICYPRLPLCLPRLSSCLASSYNVPHAVLATTCSPSLVFLAIIPDQHVSFIFSDHRTGPIYHYLHLFLSCRLIYCDGFLCLGLISKLPSARLAGFEPTAKSATTSAPLFSSRQHRGCPFAHEKGSRSMQFRVAHTTLPLPPRSQNAAALHLHHIWRPSSPALHRRRSSVNAGEKSPSLSSPVFFLVVVATSSAWPGVAGVHAVATKHEPPAFGYVPHPASCTITMAPCRES
jgi:hypothetical protein